MTNYGYDRRTKNWKENRKQMLVEALKIGLELTEGWGFQNNPNQPYLETDGLYDGVRIRRITHLGDEGIKKLVGKADKIYDEVMA